MKVLFPTELHKQVAEIVCCFFTKMDDVDTVLLTNSCARGKAVPESDVDFAILVKEATPSGAIDIIKNKWHSFSLSEPTLQAYKSAHRFAQIHLDIITGVYSPATWDDGGGPDFFEIEIGNHLLYAVPLTQAGTYFIRLKKMWLPYYGTTLQNERLNMVREACIYDLEHISFYVKRELYFQAFDRLVKAFQEFLQLLFIKHRTYPIAYNKWIREQVTEILQIPGLYEKLPGIISVADIESDELLQKAALLQLLLDEYCSC